MLKIRESSNAPFSSNYASGVMVVSVWCLKIINMMLFVFNSSIFHSESCDLSNDISQFLDLADFQIFGNFVDFYRKSNSNGNHSIFIRKIKVFWWNPRSRKWLLSLDKSKDSLWKILELKTNNIIFMLFRHHTDTTITPEA